jgi:hypothetical protein
VQLHAEYIIFDCIVDHSSIAQWHAQPLMLLLCCMHPAHPQEMAALLSLCLGQGSVWECLRMRRGKKSRWGKGLAAGPARKASQGQGQAEPHHCKRDQQQQQEVVWPPPPPGSRGAGIQLAGGHCCLVEVMRTITSPSSSDHWVTGQDSGGGLLPIRAWHPLAAAYQGLTYRGQHAPLAASPWVAHH